MKKLLTVLCSSLILFSCGPSIHGSGKNAKEQRNVANFTKLSTATSIDVDVKIGSTYDVVVEGDDNIIKYVVTKVDGNTLVIRYESNISISNADVTVHVTVPALEALSASSSSDIKVDGTLTSNGKISFSATSSAEIEANVDAPDVDVDANSSAKITLKGRTKNLKAEASSSADVYADELLSENTIANANSSGSAKVHASVQLNASASSSGSVRYKGGAKVSKTESSSGSVEKED